MKASSFITTSVTEGSIKDSYKVGKVLVAGSISEVRQAKRLDNPEEWRAVIIVNKKILSEEEK